MGQMIAVEFVADKAARRFFDPQGGAHRLVAAKALELGVLMRALPFIEVISFSPPLSMTARRGRRGGRSVTARRSMP